MPTLSFSWSDLALFGFTAGVIGTVAFAGSQQRLLPSSSSPSSNALASDAGKAAKKGNKKKKAAAKKAGPGKEEGGSTPGALSSDDAPSPGPDVSDVAAAASNKSKPKKPTKKNDPKPVLVSVSGPTGVPTVAGGTVAGEPPKTSTAPAAAVAAGTPGGQSRGEGKAGGQMRPLAERVQPKPRKTVVDDMRPSLLPPLVLLP